jgi:hypothetical protein
MEKCDIALEEKGGQMRTIAVQVPSKCSEKCQLSRYLNMSLDMLICPYREAGAYRVFFGYNAPKPVKACRDAEIKEV